MCIHASTSTLSKMSLSLVCVNLLSLALDPVYSHGFRLQKGQNETNEKVTVGKKKRRKEKRSKGDSRIRQKITKTKKRAKTKR